MMSIEKLERLVDLSMRIGTSVGATGAILAPVGGQLALEEVQEWERLMEEAGLDPYGNDDPDDQSEWAFAHSKTLGVEHLILDLTDPRRDWYN